jgi:hypothetical protein
MSAQRQCDCTMNPHYERVHKESLRGDLTARSRVSQSRDPFPHPTENEIDFLTKILKAVDIFKFAAKKGGDCLTTGTKFDSQLSSLVNFHQTLIYGSLTKMT